MIKKMIAIGLCIAFLSTVTLAFAEDVYVTKRGKSYHKEDCRFIKNRDVQEISLEEAEEKGLKPCKRCFAPQTTSDDDSKAGSTKKSKKKK